MSEDTRDGTGPRGHLKIKPACEAGVLPAFKKIEIDKLQIDQRYQRRIGKDGWASIRKIATSFRWDKFHALLVAGPDKMGDFSVLDGQHRLEALKLRPDLGAVAPCMVIKTADHREQAGIFVGVNKDRIQCTSISKFWALHTQGDSGALAVVRVAEAAGATVSRVGAGRQKPGYTVSVRAISASINRLGERLTIRALGVLHRGQEDCENALRTAAINAMVKIYGLHGDVIDDGIMIRQLGELDMDDVLDTARKVRDAFGGKTEGGVKKQIIQAYNRAKRGSGRLPEG